MLTGATLCKSMVISFFFFFSWWELLIRKTHLLALINLKCMCGLGSSKQVIATCETVSIVRKDRSAFLTHERMGDLDLRSQWNLPGGSVFSACTLKTCVPSKVEREGRESGKMATWMYYPSKMGQSDLITEALGWADWLIEPTERTHHRRLRCHLWPLFPFELGQTLRATAERIMKWLGFHSSRESKFPFWKRWSLLYNTLDPGRFVGFPTLRRVGDELHRCAFRTVTIAAGDLEAEQIIRELVFYSNIS